MSLNLSRNKARDICLFFDFATPSNSSGYCFFKLSALLVTIVMLMPTFNTPNSAPIIFPCSDIPLPLITKTSALVYLSQTATVHLALKYP